jgi:activating signal cointegrator complex subunit 3
MSKLVLPVPIESNFIKQLADHLNAEVVGGTVTNIEEAARWLTYTYMYTRMLRNPLGYGIKVDEKTDDPMLRGRCRQLVMDAAKLLDLNQMINYNYDSGNLSTLDQGRVAAHFYIQAESVATFNEMLAWNDAPSDADLCRVICAATEFRNMKLRQEELSELQSLVSSTCPLKIKGAGHDGAGHGLITDPTDKAFVLMQAYIARARIKSFTLVSDMNYIASNAGRVARAIFEICLKKQNPGAAVKLLRIAKSVDKRIWWFQTPLRHFEDELTESVYSSLETKESGGLGYDSLDTALSLLDMQPNEVAQFCRWNKGNKEIKGGEKIQKLVRALPNVEITCNVKPVTNNVFQFHIRVFPDFEWDGRWHGGQQSFWLWVEDGENNKIYHDETIIFARRTFPDAIVLDVTVPFFVPLPKQYFVRVVSDTWVAVESLLPVSLENIHMLSEKTPTTPVLDLTPLPVSALQEPDFERLYSKFDYFNPVSKLVRVSKQMLPEFSDLCPPISLADTNATLSYAVSYRLANFSWCTNGLWKDYCSRACFASNEAF